MAQANNFDQSSTGTSIEATCFYDTSLSSHNFKESIEIIQSSGYRDNTIAYYVDHGNVNGPDDIEFSIIASRDALIEYLRNNKNSFEDGINWDNEELNQAVVIDICPQINTYEQINNDMKDDNIEIKCSKNLIKIKTRGYSQGDYAEVYYCPEDLEKAWGCMPEQSEIQETIDHLFWDAPLYAHMAVNETEYFYYDCPAYSEYEWKRDEFLAWVALKSGASIEALGAVLPLNPTYN